MPKEDTWKSDRKRVPILTIGFLFGVNSIRMVVCVSDWPLCVCLCVCECVCVRARLCTCIVCSNTKKRERERERERANAILINASRRSSIVVETRLLKIQPFYVIYLILLLLIRFFFFEILIFGIFLEFLGILILIELNFWKFLSLDSLSLE